MADYTPDGSDLVFNVPAYGDVADGPDVLKGFADSVAAAVDGKAGAFAVIRTYTASHVLTADDANCIVEMNVAGANTLTVPADLPAGTQVLVVQLGAGATTIVEGDGVDIRRQFGLELSGQDAAALLYARSSTDWLAVGGLTA